MSSISHIVRSCKKHTVCHCHHLWSQCCQHLTRVCFGPLSLMQFDVVSFALDSQLLLPWKHAYKTSCSSLLLLHYNHVWSFFSIFFFLFSVSFLFLFCRNLGWEISMSPSKDALPCKQLPLQDKLLLFPLIVALIPVQLRTSVGIMMSKSQLSVTNNDYNNYRLLCWLFS